MTEKALRIKQGIPQSDTVEGVKKFIADINTELARINTELDVVESEDAESNVSIPGHVSAQKHAHTERINALRNAKAELAKLLEKVPEGSQPKDVRRILLKPVKRIRFALYGRGK